jgi:hypothetical protein
MLSTDLLYHDTAVLAFNDKHFCEAQEISQQARLLGYLIATTLLGFKF